MMRAPCAGEWVGVTREEGWRLAQLTMGALPVRRFQQAILGNPRVGITPTHAFSCTPSFNCGSELGQQSPAVFRSCIPSTQPAFIAQLPT